MPPDFEIAIIGGGTVGSTLAQLLAAAPLHIALIEARSGVPEPVRVGECSSVGDFSARTAALSPASGALLKQIGAWQLLPPSEICAYEQMQVWDADGTGSIGFEAAELSMDGDPLGWIVEHNRLEWALAQRCAKQSSLHILHGSPLCALERSGRHSSDDEAMRLELEDGSHLSARLVIAADGGRSVARRLMGIDSAVWDCQQRAIVAVVETENSHRHTAWQRFTEDGPLALLPLAGGDGHFSSVVWSVDSAVVQHLLDLDDSAFSAALALGCERCLGAVRTVGKRFSFALSQHHARDYARPGFALIGDAVRTVHPLAGQGLNLGLLDAAVLAEELLRWQRLGGTMGEIEPLLRYQRRRREHNLAMLGAMAGLQQLFSARHPLLRLVRNEGLRWVDQAPRLKRFFARRAMGV